MKERERVRRLIERRSRSNAIVYFQIIVLSTALVWLLVSIRSLSTSISSAFNALADMGVSTGSGSGAAEPAEPDRRAATVGVRTIAPDPVPGPREGSSTAEAAPGSGEAPGSGQHDANEGSAP